MDRDERVAREIAAEAAHDVAPGYGFARLPVADPWMGRSLGELDLRTTWRVTVTALRRGGAVTLNPRAWETLRAGDELVVAGLDEDPARRPASDERSEPA